MRGVKMLKGGIFLFTIILLLAGCKSKDEPGPADSFLKGTVHISCDESFRPVIDAQIQVFEARYAGTKVIAHYKPEAECMEDLYSDSIRMVIATRFISEGENEAVSDSTSVGAEQHRVAYDAVAVVVNAASDDTVFTMDEIRSLISGNLKKDLIPVFDGLKATSTVRFMIDSVLRGAPLGKNVVAAQSSEELLSYVSQNPKAVGFIGVTWIGNPEDTAQRNLRKKVKIAAVQSVYEKGVYVKPDQMHLYTGSYPMIRDLVYILRERHTGLGHGFGDFMKSDDGQLVFRRAYLAPALRTFVQRKTVMSND
jgi:phosphate transport system substrate-binding protein